MQKRKLFKKFKLGEKSHSSGIFQIFSTAYQIKEKSKYMKGNAQRSNQARWHFGMSSTSYAAGLGLNSGEGNLFDTRLIFEFYGCVGCERIKKE